MTVARRIGPLVALLLLPLLGSAQEWPQFRGPGSNGLTLTQGLPTEWGPEEGLTWKVPLPGRGWSSPVVSGDRVFVTTAVEEEAPVLKDRRLQGGRFRWEVHCLDLATGKTLWTRVAARGAPRIATHQGNTYASETPVTDGRRVYAYFGMTGLYAYDLDGTLAWKKDLGAFPMQSDWGTSSSPLLHEGTLYLQVDSEGESFLVALDPGSGEEKWRVARDEGSNWSSPAIWVNRARTELVTSGRRVRSYDPEDGRLLWEMSVLGGRSSASATGDRERIYLSSERRQDGGGHVFAVNAGASGDVSMEGEEASNHGVAWWQENAAPPMASPLVYQGVVYAFKRRTGVVVALDAETGQELYKKRVPGAPGFWASPWAYDGKVFALDDEGTTHVIRAGREFEVLRTNPLGEQAWASPALTTRGLVFRGKEHLFLVGHPPSPGG